MIHHDLICIVLPGWFAGALGRGMGDITRQETKKHIEPYTANNTKAEFATIYL